jgi:hypothetical protein
MAPTFAPLPVLGLTTAEWRLVMGALLAPQVKSKEIGIIEKA